MRTRIVAILVLLLITTAIMPVYYIYRCEYIEKEFIEELKNKQNSLKPLAHRLNMEQKPDSNRLKKIFTELIDRDKSIAAMAVTDRMGRLRFMVKNDSLLISGRIIDSLVRDIKEKKFSQADNKKPEVKNYTGSDWLGDRLYVYRFSSGGQSTIAAYSITLDRMKKIRLALELILIASGILITTAGIILLLKKSGILTENKEYRIKTIVIGERKQAAEKPGKTVKQKKTVKKASIEKKPALQTGKGKTAAQIDENELLPVAGENSEEKVGRKAKKSGTDETGVRALNEKIFILFKKIYSNTSPESVSLYMKLVEGKLSKAYELKGKSLIKIDSLSFDSIPIQDIEKKSGADKPVYRENGQILIPLFNAGTVIGLIAIQAGEKTSTININSFKKEITAISDEINSYITGENIITDSATGFYSSRFFMNRLTESINSSIDTGREFSLFLVNIFAGLDLDSNQKETILKIMRPALTKTVGEEKEIFLHEERICMILHDTAGKERDAVKSRLTGEISKFRLKTGEETILTLNPQSILRNSADSKNIKKILAEAEALIAASN